MNDDLRSIDDVIIDIKSLVRSQGYIYPLLLIIFEDFHVDPENLHQMDNYSRLNMNEASLLIGFFSQEIIDYTIPDSIEYLFSLKKRTYELMDELHKAFHKPFINDLVEKLTNGFSHEEGPPSSKDFFKTFNKGSNVIEPIFYSGTGVYDFQYLESLERKYQHDGEWLKVNKGFVFNEVTETCRVLKNYLQGKSNKVNLKFIKDRPDLKEIARKNFEGANFEEEFEKLRQMMELHQYSDLFFDDSLKGLDVKSEEFRVASHKVFYRNLIDLFSIPRKLLIERPNGQAFIDNFSLQPGSSLAKVYTGIGSYNPTQSNPLLELDEDRFLLPISFFMAEAVYDSPFYWMGQDRAYESIAFTNRGQVGEDISFDLLNKVFGTSTYRRIAVKRSKNSDVLTDIDVLCVLGSKALCVQVKSKKLTIPAKKGDDDALRKDFKGAVQDAYEQAWISRAKILDRSSKFFDEKNNEINLSEGIDEVYMLVVTSEHYPAVSHQTRHFIQLKDYSPYPLVMSVFDLELVAHYLADPYDFLYYVRQRINLMDYFIGDEEMTYLGHHLTKKLWRDVEASMIALDNSSAQIIDRNYYPYKAGINVSDDGDAIKAAWRNEKFDIFLAQIKSSTTPKITDVVFHLFDLSSETRSGLITMMMQTKMKTLEDGKHHDFAYFFNDKVGSSFGITYFSSETDSFEEVKKRISVLCQLRKYKMKANMWLGLGSIKSGRAAFDVLVYMYDTWEYDELLEEHTKGMRELSKPTIASPAQGKKVGRNEACPCGSGKKHKKCCLK